MGGGEPRCSLGLVSLVLILTTVRMTGTLDHAPTEVIRRSRDPLPSYRTGRILHID